MDDLWFSVLVKAFWDSLLWIGYSLGTIIFSVMVVLVGAIWIFCKKGWQGVKRHFIKTGFEVALFSVTAWFLVFLVHLHWTPYSLYKTERERAETATTTLKERDATISAKNKSIQSLEAKLKDPPKVKEPARSDTRPNIQIVSTRLRPLGNVKVMAIQLRNFGNVEASGTVILATKILNKISEARPLELVLAPSAARDATIEVDDADYDCSGR